MSGETPLLNPAVLMIGRLIRADLAVDAAKDEVTRHRALLAECLPHLRSTDARALRGRIVAELEAAARAESRGAKEE